MAERFKALISKIREGHSSVGSNPAALAHGNFKYRTIKTKIMKILNTIKDFYWNTIGWRLRQLIVSVKNLVRWFPLIWKDRDWDHAYIYYLLEFKLTNMAKYFRKRDFFVGQIREAEKMELCVRLMKKIQNEDYAIEFYDKLDEKYGKTINYVDPSTHLFEIKYEKSYTEEELEEIRKERWEAIVKGSKKQEKAQRILFKLMERNINRWWD